MIEFRKQAPVRLRRDQLSGEFGTTHARYSTPLDFARLYEWIPGNTDTADGLTLLDHSGGEIGRWRLVRIDIKGADLVDADATIQVGDNFLHVLPAATPLTAERTITLGTINARAGDIHRIVRRGEGGFSLLIDNGGVAGGQIFNFIAGDRWAEFYFDGTDWDVHGAGDW
jgi:hypothetical protein